MLGLVPNLNPVTSSTDVLLHRFIFIKLIAKLIKIGDLKIGPGADAPRVGFHFTKQQFQKRRFASAIGSDDPDAIAALNRQRQLVDDAAVFVCKSKILHLGHQGPASLAFLNSKPDLPRTLTPLGTLLPHRLQCSNTTFIASSPGLDPLTNPCFLLSQLLVEQSILFFFRVESRLFAFKECVVVT